MTIKLNLLQELITSVKIDLFLFKIRSTFFYKVVESVNVTPVLRGHPPIANGERYMDGN